MKRVLLISLALMVGFAVQAQNGYVKLTNPKVNQSVKASILDRIDPVVEEMEFTPETTIVSATTIKGANGMEETNVMTTKYDLQSNSSLGNRLIMWPEDGTAAATGTWGLVETAFADRGTGYNYYNGSSWGAQPSARIETIRSGWPSIAMHGENGEAIVSHTGTALTLLTRETKGADAWTEIPVVTDLSVALTWPRIATTGQYHDIIHAVAAYQDASNTLHNEVYYSKSSDGGNTWDSWATPPEVDLTFYNYNISADDYVMASNGDNVAILFASAWYDLFYIKSTDGGETWEKHVVWEHPYPTIDWNTFVTTDTLYTVDNTANLTIDNDGMVHVVWGTARVIVETAAAGSYNYFPYTDGICYWNESMGQIPENPENPHKTLDPTYLDGLGMGIVVGWVPDVNGDGDVAIFDYELIGYRTLGLSTLPGISIDENGSIAIVFSTLDETRNNDAAYFRSVYATYKDGFYGSWYYDFENLMGGVIHIFQEGFYTTTATNGSDGTFFAMYNADASPGTALDADHAYQDNYIYVVKLTPVVIGVNENINPVSDISFAYPNPVTSKMSFDINLSQSSKTAEVSLYNMTGQVVHHENLTSLSSGPNTYSIDASQLKSGVYFCTFDINGYKSTRKVVVQ